MIETESQTFQYGFQLQAKLDVPQECNGQTGLGHILSIIWFNMELLGKLKKMKGLKSPHL